jgi:hypothetical protein
MPQPMGAGTVERLLATPMAQMWERFALYGLHLLDRLASAGASPAANR